MSPVGVLLSINSNLRQSIQRNICTLRKDSYKIMLCISGKGNLVNHVVGCPSCSSSLSCIQGLTGHSGCTHFLYVVSVAVANGFDMCSVGFSLYIYSRKICRIVVDDGSHSSDIIAVVCCCFCSLIYLGGNREVCQSGELRI